MFFIKLLILGFFVNSLLPQACFCGEACVHGLEGSPEARPNSLFHNRCAGTQCKSCKVEDAQTLKASYASHPAAELKSRNIPAILFDFPDGKFGINFNTIFLYRLNEYLKVKSPSLYLQNLSFLL